ncbi:MAG: 2-phospho-L-lactate guanylyltransferase [Solirubrobacteraceae bacterium]|jgi:2-phospho-L-lactate/phosphoenolpyruvate guanylyltransferase
MSTLAILPVKSFAGAKRRLADELEPGPRRALAEAMFSDVLLALRRVPTLDEVLVVSSDRGAQRIAGGYGATVLADEERGHNAAATAGVRAALAQRYERALLVPGDCPLLDPQQLEELLARPTGPPSVLIVPDRHGTGTNALLLAPPDAMAPAFGPGSCRRHASQAQSHRIEHEVVELSSLALDVDTPDDLATLQATLTTIHGHAAHTRGMLNQLMRSRA